MSIKPQTIQIFLPDGSPTSIREAELTNRLVKAILFPRNKMEEVSKRDLVYFTGVYFLFGTNEDNSKPKVYIGEGEECFKRIQSHNRKKDFWTHCAIITTKTDEYTKTDGKYLEYYCLSKAQDIGRYDIDNDTGSKKPSISESREYDLLDNFETAKILLATLGYPIFESVAKRTSLSADLFFINRVGANAKAAYTDEGMIIYKGSEARIKETNSLSKRMSNLRQSLLTDGTMEIKNEKLYIFSKNYIAGAPSRASDIIIGNSTNGWIEWKDKNGKTLDELKRQ
ncbi:MAG: DUF4357 domain-containing protein [Bacteroidota bacterium]